MKNFIVMLTLMLFTAPVTAATYKWVDDKGTLNFTEDYGKIPKKFRKKAKVVGEEDTAPPTAIETKEEPKFGQKAGDSVDTKTNATKGKQEKKKTVYDGKEGEAWKADFGKLRADLKASEEQLVEARGRMNDTSKMSRNEYISLHNTIKAIENRVLELRKKLDSLDEAATKAGVPADLRQ
ncbi:MAG: hypothetical protein FD174_675 [Geobacteraceae bacterium]|nr:MAG: hypothetical protein FD174_675 [Geobacteraceae bacterium]